MPGSNAYDVVVRSLGGLLDAIERNPEVQPSVQAERQLLTESLTEIQGFKARQEELTALRQETTQQLTAAVARGKDTALVIRSVIRGKVGPRNERLVHFNVAPLRKRTRKAKQEKAPDGKAPGTDPGAADSPSVKPAV
jgi:hypothetical protein